MHLERRFGFRDPTHFGWDWDWLDLCTAMRSNLDFRASYLPNHKAWSRLSCSQTKRQSMRVDEPNHGVCQEEYFSLADVYLLSSPCLVYPY